MPRPDETAGLRVHEPGPLDSNAQPDPMLQLSRGRVHVAWVYAAALLMAAGTIGLFYVLNQDTTTRIAMNSASEIEEQTPVPNVKPAPPKPAQRAPAAGDRGGR